MQRELGFGAAAAPASRASAASAQAADTPHWDALLLGVADGDAAPARRLRAVTAAAGRLGLRAGMTVAAARGRCAALAIRPWDDAAVRRAVDLATASFLVASPQVTPVAGAPGLWWVGAAGFDGIGGERALVHALLRLARHWHPEPRVGLADSCVAARAATWHYPLLPERTLHAPRSTLTQSGRNARDAHGGRPIEGAVVVTRGGDLAYLATTPLALLPLEDELRATLAALGIRQAGGLATLDPGDVEARWGAAGLLAWRLARGDDPRRPGLTRLDGRRQVQAELAAPTETLEPILFLVRAALDRLAAELARDGVGAAVLALTLALDAGAVRTVTREVRLPRPVARAGPLFERCRALLERITLPAPVCGVTVAIAAIGRLGADQGDLLAPTWHDPSAAEAAFARLRAELGPQVVVRPAFRDAHRPERAGAWEDDLEASTTPAIALPTPDPVRAPVTDLMDDDTPPACRDDDGARDLVQALGGAVTDAATSGARAAPAAGALAASLRLLEAPEPVEVRCDDGGTPHLVRWRGAHWSVAHADGPERLSGDWWTGDGFHRDYWRCATAAGVLLLYATADGWCVQGWYD